MTTVPIGAAEPHSNTLFTDKPSKRSVLKQPQEFKASVDIADCRWKYQRLMTFNSLSLSTLGKVYVQNSHLANVKQ
jgi:hypothetical protein